ncbi:methylated-DNA--[protein]-cysteine S-methyltransferase [Metabacillus malikii]|uniref:Methylated-DNA-[protein]-cysteine S-methyltransferase n=1 Tax=Metabacillus malikii TaxID=1504265 RepID=A0ABT9ZBC9_9BACI|nr:methylated-DNA--[protein]-cysteine S-methyltransferase [Metabacillus malikii]MDQ0229572.1 methylated-DNA-[protein]-cysteine S-methyltransferase [Metabacillus malikii]
MNKNSIYWSEFNFNSWRFFIVATENGLCYVGSPNQPFIEVEKWVEKHFSQHHLLREESFLKPYRIELEEYYNKKRDFFSLPVDLQGTPFQKEIWSALSTIPYGTTSTYSDIAERIFKPTAARAVGRAIGANPVLITIPCHRVIGKDGSLTGYRGGMELKKFLLKLETGFIEK